MALDIVLIVVGIILTVLGIVGCIALALPGAPLNYLAIILLHFTSNVDFSPQFLVLWAIIVIIVQLLDYYIPMGN